MNTALTRTLLVFLVCVVSLFFLLGGSASPSPMAVSASTDAPSSAGDWPMLGHDPQRTGYNPDETTISASNVGQLRRAWQARVGTGASGSAAFSAPSVVSGTAYVASSVGTGDNFFAFDAATGDPRWSAFIGFNPNECFGIGIGSTPAIADGVVVIGGGDNAYYGLSAADGTQLWRNPLDAGPSAFAWASPLLAAGRAYVGVASDCDLPSVRGEVRALNLASGAHLASAYIVPEGLGGGGVWNSPALSPDGTKLVAVTGEDYKGYNGPLNRAMLVLDAQTLEVLASDQRGRLNVDDDWASTPVIFHDNTGRVLVGANHKDHHFYAYDLNDVSAGPIWSWEMGLLIGNPPAYDPTYGDGGSLIFVLHGRLTFVDPANGTVRQISDFIGPTAINVAVANGLVYVNSEGSLYILEETSGAILRKITPPLGGAALGGVALSNGVVYWTSGEYLNAWHLGPPPTPSPTFQPGVTPVPPPCPGEYFTDVCPDDYFYEPVLRLNIDGIVVGYETSPPCDNSLWVPCFKPYNSSTRGQIAKIVSLAAGFTEPVTGQQFEDVPPGSTFYEYIGRLSSRSIVSGYPCGGPGETCVPPANRPYFRVGNNVTRGQLSKMTALSFGWNEPVSGQQFQDVPPGSTFYEYVGKLSGRGIIAGYPCGGPGEPCGPLNLPYFRPNNDVTRGQTAKMVELARQEQTPSATPTAAASTTATGTAVSTTPTLTATPTNLATSTTTPTEATATPTLTGLP
jgi:outer membrane protein assembly factor BamB